MFEVSKNSTFCVLEVRSFPTNAQRRGSAIGLHNAAEDTSASSERFVTSGQIVEGPGCVGSEEVAKWEKLWDGQEQNQRNAK